MKITNHQWRGTNFVALNTGDVFTRECCPYIKTTLLGGNNAVDLSSGVHVFIYDHSDVTKVDAELVLR